MIHDADEHARPPLTPELAQRMVQFANSHDDGSPKPRAKYDRASNAVVVASMEYYPSTRQHHLVHGTVREWHDLKALLGY